MNMMNNTNKYRTPKWFAKNRKLMAEIAAEDANVSIMAEIRQKLNTDYLKPLKKGNLQSVYGVISVELIWLATGILRSGALSILSGDENGWSELRRGFLYDSWAARFRHCHVIQDNTYDKNPSNSAIFNGEEALTFCHAIATGDDDFAHGFGKHLISNLERTNGSDKILFYTIPLYPFAMKLYSVWSQIPVTYRADVLQPLGRYQQIFDNWTMPDKLADSLLDICDFHCEESTDAKNAYAAFAFHPYNLFPVEIMSIYRIREKLGLVTPCIDHPLLSSLLLNPPKSILPVEDPLLDKAIARFRSDFPDGIGW